ncbi:hypothetical protein P43SY_011733 [Pythium insidiosum]|uniref:Uncharacterized protein n=1 Tax=Pythium insidiosum TaxID=114742 RepID=A0AAD5LS55_PYTIN|nr:hypothetical protein P43SY_011733 [Pythium insidiosum]
MPPLRMKDSDALGAAARVQSLLLSERKFLSFLDAIEDSLARRLRFHAAASPSGERSVLTDVAFVCFFQHARVLAYLHRVALAKVEPLSTADHPDPSAMATAICELLVATRFTYAQLQCQRDSIALALDERGRSDDGNVVEAVIVRGFLRDQKMNGRELVARLLDHLQELLETVELIFGAPDVADVCKATREFIASVEATAANEQMLMDLQCRFDWKATGTRIDLCGKRLLAHSDQVVTLSSDSSNSKSVVVSQEAMETAHRHLVHCLDDGHIIISTPAPEGKLRIESMVNLRQSVVFFESVPLAVSECLAVVLISEGSSVIVAIKDDSRDAMTAAIAQNVEQSVINREEALQGRSTSEFEIPPELIKSLPVSPPPSVAFASLHDDLLAGLFWLRDGVNPWTLVELVSVDDCYVLALAVTGWQKHRLVCCIDTTSEAVEISEQPRPETHGDDGGAWSLVVRGATTTSEGAIATIELLSSRRTRIDYWYDQVSKSLEAARVARQKRRRQEEQAARRAERERAKNKAAEDTQKEARTLDGS